MTNLTCRAGGSMQGNRVGHGQNGITDPGFNLIKSQKVNSWILLKS
jgi:hypothetical protein